MKDEEEQRKARGQEEREKRLKRREKLFQILQKREDGELLGCSSNLFCNLQSWIESESIL